MLYFDALAQDKDPGIKALQETSYVRCSNFWVIFLMAHYWKPRTMMYNPQPCSWNSAKRR